MEIAVRVHVVQRIYRISPDILDRFLKSFHHMKALYMQMMHRYLIFRFLKGRCHGTKSFVNARYNTAKKLAYFVKYFRIYWTYFRNLFTI